MNAELLARATTLALILEAVQRFGPIAEKTVQTMLDESPHATSYALSRLLLDGRVEIVRAAGRGVVLYRAVGGG